MKINYKQKCYYTDYTKEYNKKGTFYKINNPIPKLVTIKPTLCCVANCLHCNPRSKKFSGKRLLTLNEYDELFKKLHQMGTEGICISGGEPLLYKDIVPLVRLITKNKMKASLNTNGWLLTKNMFIELMNAGLLAINVSIDSPFAEIHDGLRNLNGLFDKTIFQLRECKKLNIPFVLNIRMVLSKYNFKDIDKMIDLARSLNADLLSIDMIEADSKNKFFLLNSSEIMEFKNKYVPIIIEKINAMNINDKLKKFNIKEVKDIYNIGFNGTKNFENGVYWPDDKIKSKCDIPSTFMIIEGDGTVLPCNAVEYNRNKFIGNIFESSIDKMWKCDKWEKFRKSKMEFCRECPMNMSYMLIFDDNKIEREISNES